MPLKTKDYKRVHFTPDYSDFAKFIVSKVLIRLQCFFLVRVFVKSKVYSVSFQVLKTNQAHVNNLSPLKLNGKFKQFGIYVLCSNLIG